MPPDLSALGASLIELAADLRGGPVDSEQLARVLEHVGLALKRQHEEIDTLKHRLERIEAGRPMGRAQRKYTT